MNARRTTPDSEAVGSSEDERPWPASTAFGQIRMRNENVPGLPGIWTSKRGSFKMGEAAKRNVLQEVRLGSTNPAQSALRSGSTPSPASDRAGALPVAIPLQPVQKLGRSLSHSQGQRDTTSVSGNHNISGAATHGAPIPLGLLAEEVDTESESDLGSKLTHTASHPPIGSLLRTTTLPAAYETMDSRFGNGGGDRARLGEYPSPHLAESHERRLEASFANLSFADPPPRRSQWQSSLGWDDVRNVNESRRHSLADIPTRRGSLVGAESGFFGNHNNRMSSNEVFESDDAVGMSSGFGTFALADRAINPQNNNNTDVGHSSNNSANFDIPLNYRVPQVDLSDHERNELSSARELQGPNGIHPWGSTNPNRPRKLLFIVSFKCSRVDVFYLLDNTGLTVREGDLVIVEADRGQDLGTVQHANVTPEMARNLKKKYSEEQYKWLMMYSQNKEGASNPNAEMQRESTDRPFYGSDASATLHGNTGFQRDNVANLKPKAIKRLAQNHEIHMLTEKEGNEAKAKRACQQKVAHLRLQMEILDAEWQWDFQKLIFYYYADHYIDFKNLITELYRIYKTRIWLSAINPASFSQHAINQAPSGIGPGAVYNPFGLNNSYTMTYGEDRDPYGAQMPYRIGYETYTPNFPGIPGVPNSFAPSPNPYMQGYLAGHAGQAHPGHAAANQPTAQQLAGLSYPNDHSGPGGRQTYDYHTLYNLSGNSTNSRPSEAAQVPQMMQQADLTRPSYGSRPPGGSRNGQWDKSSRFGPAGNAIRDPGSALPIGTRAMPSSDGYVSSGAYQQRSTPGMDPQAAHFNINNGGNNHTTSMPGFMGGVNGSDHRGYIHEHYNQPSSNADPADEPLAH